MADVYVLFQWHSHELAVLGVFDDEDLALQNTVACREKDPSATYEVRKVELNHLDVGEVAWHTGVAGGIQVKSPMFQDKVDIHERIGRVWLKTGEADCKLHPGSES